MGYGGSENEHDAGDRDGESARASLCNVAWSLRSGGVLCANHHFEQLRRVFVHAVGASALQLAMAP
jgi:hypothetical protein